MEIIHCRRFKETRYYFVIKNNNVYTDYVYNIVDDTFYSNIYFDLEDTKTYKKLCIDYIYNNDIPVNPIEISLCDYGIYIIHSYYRLDKIQKIKSSL